MDTYAKLCLFSYETRQPLRELTPEEQDMYQAMLDTYSPAERQLLPRPAATPGERAR